VNIEQLIFATTAMIVATAIAIGVAKKLNLGSIVSIRRAWTAASCKVT
jgi:hypothetical protein